MPAKKTTKVKDLKPKAVKGGKAGSVRGGSRGTGTGAGKITVSPFSISKKTDKSSANLF